MALNTELFNAYVGPNASHQTFRLGMANAKALLFILVQDEEAPLRGFLADAAQRRAQAPGGVHAFGIGGRVTPTSIQFAVHFTTTEIDLIAASTGGFQAQIFGLIYREVYRVFESYLADLYEEIGLVEPRILTSNQKLTYEEALAAAAGDGVHRFILSRCKQDLTRKGLEGIERAFLDFGLALLAMTPPAPMEEQIDVRKRLARLSAVRNIVEHNQSIVNAEFLRLVPDSPWPMGSRVAISWSEFGDAISAAEFTADDLNRRAVVKFPKLASA
jgi:hypothetical protein